jgi:hypothetical protein
VVDRAAIILKCVGGMSRAEGPRMTRNPSLAFVVFSSALLSTLLWASSSSAQASGTVVITIEGTFTVPSAPVPPTAPLLAPAESAAVELAPPAPPSAPPPAPPPAPLLAPIPTVVLAPVPPAYGPQTYAPQTYEPSSSVAYAPTDAAPRARRRWGLVASGAAMVIAAYALNIGGTLLALALPFSNGHRDQLFGSALVPVAGPLLQIAYRDADWQIPFYLVSSGLQIAGFVMAFVGTFTTTTVAADDATATLSVTPYATGDGAGLMAAGTF